MTSVDIIVIVLCVVVVAAVAAGVVVRKLKGKPSCCADCPKREHCAESAAPDGKAEKEGGVERESRMGAHARSRTPAHTGARGAADAAATVIPTKISLNCL